MAIILKSGTSGNLASIEADGSMRVTARGAAIASTSATIAAGATGALGPFDVSTAGNVSFIVKNALATAGWTGNPVIVFEQSDDQVSWTPLITVRSDTSQALSLHALGPGAPNTSIVFDAGLEGVNWARARITTATTTGALTIVAQPGGLAFSPSVALVYPQRLSVVVYGAALAVGTSGTESLLTLTQQKGLATTNVANSFTVPAGRRFRLQSMVITQVGSATATAGTTVFRLRYNPAGAVTTASTPILMQSRLAAPAQATSFQQLALPIPDNMEMPGDGIGQYGVTVTPTFTTNAPTIDVLLVGYEY